MQFLDNSNVCGQTILRIVSRGNSIIAELLRLSSHIPPLLKNPTKKYEKILFAFEYVQNSDRMEQIIENSAELLDLDAEFKENHMEILKRFYLLFESIYKYVTDYVQWLEDVEQGTYMQQTLENILTDSDGKQLITEGLYLFGVMLILLDLRIPGLVRERMLISYLRYIGSNEVMLIDEVCKLCARTGFDENSKKGRRRPAKYPEMYFSRIRVPKKVVEMIVARLRTDDIYNYVQAYPKPMHRSTALSTQAQMLYIILYFAPDILNEEPAIMREIVDKHFPDNWVIVYYLGFTVDLGSAWAPYNAAKNALANTLRPENVVKLKALHLRKGAEMLKVLMGEGGLLSEGVLVERFILQKRNTLMGVLRDCNATLRWLILHTNTTCNTKITDIMNKGVDKSKLLLLLLNTAQFEFILKNAFLDFLRTKEEKWNKLKKESSDKAADLGKVFGGEYGELIKVKTNDGLKNWFVEISKQIIDLDYNDTTVSGRKMQQLIQALEEVEQLHQIETDIRIRQSLVDTRKTLQQMIRILHVTENQLVIFQIVTDVAYARDLIVDYVKYMQARIRSQPNSVVKLRSLFLKLANALEVPLVRILAAGSKDLVSVSHYYSNELVAFVRVVLSVVPKSMFDILNDIIKLQTGTLKELPTQVDKDLLREEFAQLETRAKLSKLTHRISVFTRGMLAMTTTLVGVIEVEPKQMLEDGIRKELVSRLNESLHRTLMFQSHKIQEFEAKLKILAVQLNGFQQSFMYMQDYVAIYGLKIWQEEFSRIVSFAVEQECNSFLKKKIFSWQSMYQSETIPIPVYPPIDANVNFIGRLCQELLLHTSYAKTIFLDRLSGWYDTSGRELVGIKTLSLMQRAIGVFGVTGLDRLLCFRMARDLGKLATQLRDLTKSRYGPKIIGAGKALNPTMNIPENGDKIYQQVIKDTAKFWTPMTNAVSALGQKQLIRRQISNMLKYSCKLESNMLCNALDIMNKALITDIRAHYRNPDEKPYPAEDNPLLGEVAKYVENAGIHNPFAKIYMTTNPIENFSLILALSVISQMPKYTYNRHLGLLMPKTSKGAIDATAFLVGVITVLKQFHSINTQKFLSYLGQYVRSSTEFTVGAQRARDKGNFPIELSNTIIFLEEFCKFSGLTRRVVEGYLPGYMFDAARSATQPAGKR